MKKVTIIDYGLSNLLSVQHAFAHFGAETLVTGKAEDVLAADALVLPGVGAFKDGMAGLEKLGLARRQRSETDRRVIYVCATEKYNALRAKAATDVSGYFSSLLSGMSQEDRAMIAAAFQKLDDALLQAGTEQSGP